MGKKSYLKSALFKTLTDKGKTTKVQPDSSCHHQKEKLTRSGKIQTVHCTGHGRGCERTKGIYMGKKSENLKWENIRGYNGETNYLYSLVPAKHGGK